LRDAGAQQAERTRRYVSSASTVGVQAAERSRLFRGPKNPRRPAMCGPICFGDRRWSLRGGCVRRCATCCAAS